jgi:hypothetical protein
MPRYGVAGLERQRRARSLSAEARGDDTDCRQFMNVYGSMFERRGGGGGGGGGGRRSVDSSATTANASTAVAFRYPCSAPSSNSLPAPHNLTHPPAYPMGSTCPRMPAGQGCLRGKGAAALAPASKHTSALMRARARSAAFAWANLRFDSAFPLPADSCAGRRLQATPPPPLQMPRPARNAWAW